MGHCSCCGESGHNVRSCKKAKTKVADALENANEDLDQVAECLDKAQTLVEDGYSFMDALNDVISALGN